MPLRPSKARVVGSGTLGRSIWKPFSPDFTEATLDVTLMVTSPLPSTVPVNEFQLRPFSGAGLIPPESNTLMFKAEELLLVDADAPPLPDARVKRPPEPSAVPAP